MANNFSTQFADFHERGCVTRVFIHENPMSRLWIEITIKEIKLRSCVIFNLVPNSFLFWMLVFVFF